MIRPAIVFAGLTAVVTVTAVQVLSPPAPRLIWNASPSAPIGLYRVSPERAVRRGDLVAITPPEPLAGFLAERGYLPLGVPLLKHVVAVAGQCVCRAGAVVSIDGVPAATALGRDRRGRALPSWRGCEQLGPNQVFALNATPDSLDGRYFGPLPTSSVIGRAQPIWLSSGRPRAPR